MTKPPDRSVVRAFLARAARRLAYRSAAEGAAVGLTLGIAFSLVGVPKSDTRVPSIAIGIALAVVGAIVRLVWSAADRRRVAFLVERRAPQCRNLVITANELDGNPSVAQHIVTLVQAQAARLVNGLDPAALFPTRAAFVAFVAAAALWTVAITRTVAPASAISRAIGGGNVPTVDDVVVDVEPPAYAAQAKQSLRDPQRVEALVGSRLRIKVHSSADSIAIETLSARLLVRPNADRLFSADIVADADGYIAVEPRSMAGTTGARRLIGLSVTPDAPPHARISAPGKDLFLRDARRTIDLVIEATDDIGLASLRLRYTKVSGSGERFTFIEGEVPLAITRTDPRKWTARAAWNLESLGLSPGDMVVYRAVAADQRPGATPTESDSFIAEILAPGGMAVPGFAVDPEQERYAVSQQMVIVKTERLSARKAQMPAEEFASASAELAAEQRKVRAEFVFMMGGELSDAPDPADLTELNEEAEAAGEDDLLAGRNANQGRVALLRAIRAMSRAAASLTNVDLQTALSHERAALAQLERAFSHTRIILRALTERERLDLSRRLSGVLTDAARDSRPILEAAQDPRVAEMRRSLAGIASVAGNQSLDPRTAVAVSALAERVLRIDPSSKSLQDIAALLARAADAIARGRGDDARRALDDAATSLAGALRSDLLNAPRTQPSTELDRLGGALGDALRSSRGPP